LGPAPNPGIFRIVLKARYWKKEDKGHLSMASPCF